MGLLSWEPELGWTVGRNLRVEYRWSPVPGDLARLAERRGRTGHAAARGHPRRWSARPRPCCNRRRAPFRSSWRPVGNGHVESLARPGGNTTGFIQFEYSLAGKWMELLKEV